MLNHRRDALVVVTAIGLGNLVEAQAQDHVTGVSHGRHTDGVNGLERLDQLEDPVQLPEGAVGLCRREFETGELCDPRHVGSCERQWKTPIFVVN